MYAPKKPLVLFRCVFFLEKDFLISEIASIFSIGTLQYEDFSLGGILLESFFVIPNLRFFLFLVFIGKYILVNKYYPNYSILKDVHFTLSST